MAARQIKTAEAVEQALADTGLSVDRAGDVVIVWTADPEAAPAESDNARTFPNADAKETI